MEPRERSLNLYRCLIPYTKNDRVVSFAHKKRSRGLNQKCKLCNKEIDNVPYFSHYRGRQGARYYHLQCAIKVHLLELYTLDK
jgi:hypothetical protein